MRPGPAARRSHVEGAGIGLGVGDEFGARLHRNGRMHLHHKIIAGERCNRCNVAQEIEVEIRIERGVDRAAERDHRERIAVRRRLHDLLHRDVAARARPIVDDELLAEALRQPLADEARIDVVRAAGGKTDHDAHGPRRITLRARHVRRGRERRGAGDERQKSATGEFHAALPDQPFKLILPLIPAQAESGENCRHEVIPHGSSSVSQ